MAGDAIYREDLPLVMNRRGHDEQTRFTFSYSPVRDASGAVAGMFCACWETTQKFRAEQALQEANHTLERRVSEALAERKALADIVESTDTIVQMLDREGRWLAFNRAARWRLRAGLRRRSAGRSQPVRRPGACARAAGCGEGRAGSARSTARSSPRSPSSAIRHASAALTRSSSTPCADGDGVVVGAYQFVTDVTERLQGAGAASPGGGSPASCAEAGVARPAHRRRGARLQQPAAGDPQRPQPDRARGRCVGRAGARSKACAARSSAAPTSRATCSRSRAASRCARRPSTCGCISTACARCSTHSLRGDLAGRDAASAPTCGRWSWMRASSSSRC